MDEGFLPLDGQPSVGPMPGNDKLPKSFVPPGRNIGRDWQDGDAASHNDRIGIRFKRQQGTLTPMSTPTRFTGRHRLRPALLALCLAGGLGGCSTQKQLAGEAGVSAEAGVEAPTERASGALPLLTGPSQVSINRALDLLNAGQEEDARAELLHVLQLEPGNKLAAQLLRHTRADPVGLLGREAYLYTVKPNESLSRIAMRVLGDPFAFYILARYNDIKVPSSVVPGQVIRLPGKVFSPPAPAPTPAHVSPPAAHAPVHHAPPPTPASPGPTPAQAVSVVPASPALPSAALVDVLRPAERKARIDAAVRRGHEKLKSHDLSGSLEQWDLVLSLDALHAVAKRERERVLKLLSALCKRSPAGKAECP